MKTFLPQVDAIDRTWYEIDASDVVLGRLASRVATLLMGKNKPSYTDFLDTGDFVIVTNADKVRLTGNKWEAKVYYSHTGRPGSLKETTAREMLAKHPDRLVRFAVKGMLPKSKLGKKMIRKLKIYAGGEHPHRAQQPQTLTV